MPNLSSKKGKRKKEKLTFHACFIKCADSWADNDSGLDLPHG